MRNRSEGNLTRPASYPHLQTDNVMSQPGSFSAHQQSFSQSAVDLNFAPPITATLRGTAPQHSLERPGNGFSYNRWSHSQHLEDHQQLPPLLHQHPSLPPPLPPIQQQDAHQPPSIPYSMYSSPSSSLPGENYSGNVGSGSHHIAAELPPHASYQSSFNPTTDPQNTSQSRFSTTNPGSGYWNDYQGNDPFGDPSLLAYAPMIGGNGGSGHLDQSGRSLHGLPPLHMQQGQHNPPTQASHHVSMTDNSPGTMYHHQGVGGFTDGRLPTPINNSAHQFFSSE